MYMAETIQGDELTCDHKTTTFVMCSIKIKQKQKHTCVLVLIGDIEVLHYENMLICTFRFCKGQTIRADLILVS